MSPNQTKLRNLLAELFQLDQADLDFGIYRIMNTKRDEVLRFLDKDLLPQVQEAFKQYKSADKSGLQSDLDKAIEQARGLGVDPETTNKVKYLRQKLSDSSVDVTALENEVFSHLFNFFRRYYSEGDFISQRRYKEGVYAIPYEGEEVKLHWANADQYYIKSSETFRDYTFKIASGKRVRVHLVAASTEQDNNKAAPGKERRFVLAEKPLAEENGELFIKFEYRPFEGKEKQDDLNRQAIEAVLNTPGFEHWAQELGKLAPTEKKKDRTVLEKHLMNYTARNTFDYFIHKDLGGFLRRELDFYIKNEVMHLDDIEHESAPKVEQYLSQIKVIRSIAHKIILFLEQLENFQKKLWLKKKFVIETNYCITLDRVPEELYPEIAANDAQREEWVRLFAIDEIEKDLNQPGYSKPLKVEFLNSNPFLVLDTRYFTQTFVAVLLRSIANYDAELIGTAIHSDNFQALSLTGVQLKKAVRTTYIDPPYNTGNDGFVYKDGYQQSTWLSMMQDRLRVATSLLEDGGAFISSIDDYEAALLKRLLIDAFSVNGCIADIVWQKRYAPDIRTAISDAHEYVFVFSNNADEFKRTRNKLPLTDAQIKQFSNPDNDSRGPWKADNFTAQGYRPNQMYEITTPSGRVVRPPSGRCWVVTKEVYEQLKTDLRMYFAKDGDGQPAVKRFLKEMDGMVPWTWWNHEDAGHSQDGMKESMSLFGRGEGFVTAKPLKLITRLLTITSQSHSLILDFFAGSGTTAHAVIEMNRLTNSSRKYTVIEMASYFDATLIARIKKAIYSSEWKEGKPTSRKGQSHFCKYLRLESYEDALNNLDLKRTEQQSIILDADPDTREQYLLSYMLDVESRASQSLLNIDAFRNPNEYKLRVERNGETQLVNVDLVETFNWLLGLTVKHIDVIPFKKGGTNVRVVQGTNPTGDRVLVLWRNIDELDNDKLDEWFNKQGYNTRDLEYDLVYVNGDNNLENLRRTDQTWKVRLIEEEFQRLMFDVQDV